MRNEEQIKELLNLKMKLNIQLIEYFNELPKQEGKKRIQTNKMIEIQKNEIELLRWVLGQDNQ